MASLNETGSPAASLQDPKKLLGAGCDIWGARRLALAVVVKKVMLILQLLLLLITLTFAHLHRS